MGKTRLSGLISGMDTDSLISQMVEARRSKVDKQKGEQTKLGWKQDIWKGLNKKLKTLNSTISNMRFSSSYQKKTTNVSNPNKASVITGGDAVNSVQSLKITQLAKSGYLTGGVVSATDENSETAKATALSKLSDLGYTGGATTLNISTEGRDYSINITADSTISDVLTAIKDKGLNASFDATNQRFFISSKTSGEKSDFTLTASSTDGQNALSALGLANYDKATMDAYKAFSAYTSADVAKEAKLRAQDAANSYKTMFASLQENQKKVEELSAKGLKAADEYEDELAAAKSEVEALEAEIKGYTSPADLTNKIIAQEKLEEAKKKVEEITAQQNDAKALATAQDEITSLTEKIADAQAKFTGTTVTDDDGNIISYEKVQASDELTASVEAEFAARKTNADKMLADYEAGKLSSAATKVKGQDATIELNGATFTNNTNVFEINGLTITAMAETAEGEEITLTTQDDTSGIYDMVKKLLTTYNDIMHDLSAAYNADNADKYSPLTDDEKASMSDNEVEKYEQKIKDGLLRNDSTVSKIMSSLSGIMSGGITVNGETVYLSEFGIGTGSYFSTEKADRYALHIDGDKDDEVTSGNTDKLLSLISSDPDKVVSFFSALNKDLYSKMSDLSSAVSGTRTYGSFFEDTKMTSDYKNYKTKIEELEEKLNDYEDSLYSKFAKMETAMAKLQKNTSAITGLLGGNQ